MYTLPTRTRRAAMALVLALSLVAALPVQAQEARLETSRPSLSPSAFSFGLRAGLAETDFYGDAVGSAERGAGFTVGTFLTYRLNPAWALQPEVLFTRRRGKVDHTGIFDRSRDANYTFGFVEVPLLVKAYLPEQQVPKPYLTFGPYAAVRITEKAEDMNHVLQNVDIDDELRTWDYGLTAGLGIGSYGARGTLSFDVRYNWGLANLFAGNVDRDFRTRGLMFSAELGL